MKLIHLTRRKI